MSMLGSLSSSWGIWQNCGINLISFYEVLFNSPTKKVINFWDSSIDLFNLIAKYKKKTYTLNKTKENITNITIRKKIQTTWT